MGSKDLNIKPELEIIKFGTVDIIRTSGGYVGPEEDETPEFVFGV